MKNRRYTKKQKDAIEHVVVMLDELDNKPRRLYSALREFAAAFSGKHEGMNAAIINRIDQAESAWYEQWDFEHQVAEILNTLRRRHADMTNSLAEEKFVKDYRSYGREKASDEEVQIAWRAYTKGAEEMRDHAMRVFFHFTYPELDKKFERYD